MKIEVSGFALDMFPGWGKLMRMPLSERKLALANPATRTKLDVGARSGLGGPGALISSNWSEYIFAEVFSLENKPFQGRKVGEVAAEQGKRPFDALIDVVIADDLPGKAGRLAADAVGIYHVIVNGRSIVREQNFLHTFPEKILRSGTDTETVKLVHA